MPTSVEPNILGNFLRTRRAELSPAAVGLHVDPVARRVPGLRREEVARLASISEQYYTRIEQGRLRASTPILESLAEVLHLDDDERVYLLALAGKEAPARETASSQRVSPVTQRLLTCITVPAIVLGRRMDILAWNRLATLLLTDFGDVPVFQRNYARLVFSDSEMADRYRDWDTAAMDCVAYLRMEAGRNPNDPQMAELIDELSAHPTFRQGWESHKVAAQTNGIKHLRHPRVGPLTLDWETLAVASDPDQHVVVWTAEPGTASDASLRSLHADASN